MNIFRRKKIDTVLFWKKKVEYLFSKKFESAFQLLLSTKKNILQDVPSALIKEHIIAAYIELLEISIGRNGASREKRYEILRIQEETIEKFGSKNIANLVSEYNQKFGSSMVDGVRPMAKFFTVSIKGMEHVELENFIYELFYLVLRDSFEELKKLKLS